ncbi:auxin response factor 13-like [Hordeum vulgare subsp. vulgare]|uniref:Auxin response factor n=1 Tax=Hordeum vulgare subsp. vulgare TaxID=112509 RepID=A0A287XRM0_HORVV|nr:auxin response factor 13-like [Hordeum vulgare subsp. vulgare]
MAAQSTVDRVRAASIVALSRLPPQGTKVCYFARGHAEQWPGTAEPEGHGVPCTVASINYFTDGDEPCARISLQPQPAADDPPAADDHNPAPPPGRFLFFAKTIQESDKQRCYLGIPKACEAVFLPFQAGQNEQQLKIQDISGHSWDMVRKNEGTKRLLKGQWKKFVEHKGVKVKDTILFVSCPPDGEILVDLRLAAPHNIAWGVEEVAEASQLAIQGNAFTVTYYPGRGVDPFIVPRAVVEAAAGTKWEVDMPVRLRPKDEVVHLQEQEQGSAAGVTKTGTIAAVNPGTTWRNLQVDWDASTSSTPAAAINMWQVEPQGTHDAKRRRISHTVPPVAST